MSVSQWNEERARLEEALCQAASALAGHTGADASLVGLCNAEGLGAIYVATGNAESIKNLLSDPPEVTREEE